jgi:hypothetical protein
LCLEGGAGETLSVSPAPSSRLLHAPRFVTLSGAVPSPCPSLTSALGMSLSCANYPAVQSVLTVELKDRSPQSGPTKKEHTLRVSNPRVWMWGRQPGDGCRRGIFLIASSLVCPVTRPPLRCRAAPCGSAFRTRVPRPSGFRLLPPRRLRVPAPKTSSLGNAAGAATWEQRTFTTLRGVCPE